MNQMDIEYLRDYEAKENEELNNFLESLHKGKKDANITYPSKKRFHKLREPVGKAYCGLYESIWSQIPLFGSLIIEVDPIQENFFYQAHGIEKKDLERLIDFCKDTGKVQFMINGNPELYVGLDFLSPLFEELHPPLTKTIPLSYLFESEKINKYITEFDTLVNLPSENGKKFIDIIKYVSELGLSNYSFNELLYESLEYYAFLKEYGYNDIIDYFENLLVSDSIEAGTFLGSLGKIIVDTKLDAFNSDRIIPLEVLNNLSSCFSTSDLMEMCNIHEIGENLLNKLTFMPESFDACKDVIARYDQEDLYKVSASLHKGITESNPDLISKKNTELSEIFDNVWDDAKLEKRIKGVNYGIPITMTLIGALSGPVGGVGGLLAGLGINVASEIFTQDPIVEKYVKKTVQNHVVNIFDFRKKYNIPIK